MANEYGCSDTLAGIIEDETGGDMLRAIKRLGPKRVQFIPGPCPSTQTTGGTAGMLVKWRLDGERATVGEICRAAGMAPPAKERGQVREKVDAA